MDTSKRPSTFKESSESKRTKRLGPVVSVFNFYAASIKIMNDIEIINDDFKIPNLQKIIQSFLDNTTIEENLNLNEDKKNLPDAFKQQIYFKICNELIDEIDCSGHIDRKFSYEAFKHFLVSYKKKLNISSFQNSNFSKPKNSISNKDTMLEFSKNPVHFINLIQKMPEEEIKMYKSIIENNLSFDQKIHSFLSEIPQYKLYKEEDFQIEDVVYIPISSLNRIYVIVTQNAKLLYDGQTITFPSASVEKNIKLLKKLDYPNLKKKELIQSEENDINNEEQKCNFELKDHHYVVFDMMLDNMDIIDLIDSNFLILSEKYEERLNFCLKYFEYSLICGEINESNKSNNQMGSYIKKYSLGLLTPTFIFNKVLTTAVVGLKDNRAFFAFSDEAGNLIHKGSTDVNLNSNIFLDVQEIETNPILFNAHSENCYYNIMLNDNVVKLFLKEKDFPLFKKAIPFTLKEHKLDERSTSQISNVNEFRINRKENSKLEFEITNEKDARWICAKIKNSPFFQWIVNCLNSASSDKDKINIIDL